MTTHESGGWLQAILVDPKHDLNHIVERSCSCYACKVRRFEFTRTFWIAAARHVGIKRRFATGTYDILAKVSAAEREVLVESALAALRDLPASWTPSDSLRTIIEDLGRMLAWYDGRVLATVLAGTAAGEAIAWVEGARAREHTWTLEANARFTRNQEKEKELEKYRLLKREQQAIEKIERQANRERRRTEREELRKSLSRLSVGERLSRFAGDSALNLDAVNDDLISAQETDLVGLDTAQAIMLITRIDRRRGAWARLRRLLELHVNKGTGR